MVILITLTEAAERLGIQSKSSGHLQVTSLIRHYGIPTQKIGRATVIDEAGFEQLKTAHDAWVNRPRISKLRQSVSN